MLAKIYNSLAHDTKGTSIVYRNEDSKQKTIDKNLTIVSYKPLPTKPLTVLRRFVSW